MYCIRCGVRLADTEKSCPLCGTRCYHPDIPLPDAAPLYPRHKRPQPQVNPLGIMSALTALTLLPILVCLLCDLHTDLRLSWSGIAIGAIALFYELFLLPGWFRKPNPVIFVPCGFAAVIVFLHYVNWYTGSDWFLGFAFPLLGGIGIINTVLVTLLRYVRRGKLYIFGGCTMALGMFTPVLEFVSMNTFHNSNMIWSVYPFCVLTLLGGYLIFLGICKPARESMCRKFFI